jgi:primosomal protein N' (replication factor Y)
VEDVRPIDRVLDRQPSVPAELLRLCRWVADYYIAPLGVVLRAALPAVLSDTGRTQPPVKTRRVLRIVRELPSLRQRDELFGRAVRQRECYEAVEAAGGQSPVSHLGERLRFSDSVLRGLVDKGVAEIIDEREERDPFAALPTSPPIRHEHTVAQRAALARLIEAARLRPEEGRSDRPFLLHGVTG